MTSSRTTSSHCRERARAEGVRRRARADCRNAARRVRRRASDLRGARRSDGSRIPGADECRARELTADLPASAGAAPPPAKRRAWMLSIFAPMTRRHRRLAPETVVLSLFAPARLDLRSVSFPSCDAAITVVSAFAPVFVTVPEHIDVDTSVFAVFAPVQEGAARDVPPGAPRLRIRGLSLFGPVFVQVRRS